MNKITDPKILIVEDTFADAEITKKKLARFMSINGLTVVRSTREAMEKLRADHFSCVLLDLNLPDSIGPSSIEQIKVADPRVPIIVLTGFAAPVTIEEALKAGAKTVISKNDMDWNSLREAVEKFSA